MAWEDTQWAACCLLGPFSVRKKPSAAQFLTPDLFSGWFVASELAHFPLGLVLPLQWLHFGAAYAFSSFSLCKLRVLPLSSFCPPLPHPCLVHWGHTCTTHAPWHACGGLRISGFSPSTMWILRDQIQVVRLGSKCLHQAEPYCQPISPYSFQPGQLHEG